MNYNSNKSPDLYTINATIASVIDFAAANANNLTKFDLFLQKNIHYIEISLYLLYTFIFVFGILGNSVVIYVLISSICMNRNFYYLNQHLFNTNVKKNDPPEADSPLMRQNSARSTRNEGSFKKKQPTNRTNSVFSDKLKPRQSKLNDIEAEIENSAYQLNYSFSMSQKKSFGYKFGKTVRKFLKGKLTVTNFYLLNLAISDFIYILFIPFLLCTMLYERWLFGSVLCKIYFTFAYLCQCSTVYILVVLSVDRYLSVKYPLKVASFRSDKKARVIIFSIWMLSVLYVIPITLVTKIQNSTCIIVWPESWNFTSGYTNLTILADYYLPPLYAFTIFTFTFNYLIPVSIIVILYSQILHKLSKIKNALKLSETKKKSHRRITKMVFKIIICYILSWSPYWFTQIFHYVYQVFLKQNFTDFLSLLSHLAQVVAYMSSAINPFIYR